MADTLTRDILAVASRIARAFEKNRERLNELDALLGDGDHGMSMARGFSAVAAYLEANPPMSIGDALMKSGSLFNEVSGSTIGILMFSAMREAGKAVAGRATLTLADLAEMLEAAIGAIRRRGKSEVGQKTILDSLQPAAEALKSGLAAGDAPVAVLRGARDAAARGAEATRNLEPVVGRARWFAARGKGELDPGAVSGSILVGELVGYLLGEPEDRNP